MTLATRRSPARQLEEAAMDFVDAANIYQRYLSAEIDHEIAAEDQMYASGPDWYF